MTRDDARAIWDRVVVNNDRLAGCERHAFPRLEAVLQREVRCDRCGGHMPYDRVCAYVRGYAAAGGDPDVVMPGLLQRRPPCGT